MISNDDRHEEDRVLFNGQSACPFKYTTYQVRFTSKYVFLGITSELREKYFEFMKALS